MSAADPFKEIEELKTRADRLEEQLATVKGELAAKREALQARLDSIAPAARARSTDVRPRGENLANVKKAIAEGVTDIAKLAQRCGITNGAVKKYLKVIEDEKGDDDEPEEKPAPRVGRPPGPVVEETGATLGALQIAVKAQQAGVRSKKARLLTEPGADGHKHVVELDAEGNGLALVAGPDRHFHNVRDFVLRTNAGPGAHRHGLTTTGAD